ncbi:hypothetical protein E1264_01230 [Actinomadura sp. KC216]|uniref:hypothetical protein n=1 Tax=Actinomadura sp. KC216 TaxID=2530370 RepID=UPI001047CDE9|nr:hypothetical protein [Actinomadura sp. KC216]TDB91603.1 hypothetical protein E1264_01230 [Actinomadura sp. KC216]
MNDYSSVVVRDEHVEALRLFLLGDPEWPKALKDPEREGDAFALMVYAAFAVVVRRELPPTFTYPQIVRYVADLRTSRNGGERGIDPRVTENLIRAALGDASVDEEPDPAPEIVAAGELAVLEDLLPRSVADEAGLEDFLGESAAFARAWLTARQEREQASAG